MGDIGMSLANYRPMNTHENEAPRLFVDLEDSDASKISIPVCDIPPFEE